MGEAGGGAVAGSSVAERVGVVGNVRFSVFVSVRRPGGTGAAVSPSSARQAPGAASVYPDRPCGGGGAPGAGWTRRAVRGRC